MDTSLKALEDDILSGMVNVGKSCEPASRLLWLLAKDLYGHHAPPHRSAIRAVNEQEWNSELVHWQVISVSTTFALSSGRTSSGTGLEKKLKRLFFTDFYWVSMDKNISVSKNGDD
ncbi:hypothetical protein F5141DRAFT_1063242 [Pisolithus sp. B1]|nr:hypothetical protein F5141DRAFT_1063242 [Pisolithus sp. B1]